MIWHDHKGIESDPVKLNQPFPLVNYDLFALVGSEKMLPVKNGSGEEVEFAAFHCHCMKITKPVMQPGSRNSCWSGNQQRLSDDE